MAPRAFGSRRWNSWRSWPPSCPCRASTWCAMAAVWRRTATCVGRSSPRHASRAWTNRRHGHGVASLELGTAAEARLCAGHGALPLVSAGGAADHRRHHAGRGDPEDPPASEACRRPTSHCPSACPPGSLRLVLRLTAPRASPTRLRPLPWGGTTPPPSPAPPAVSPHTARGWGGLAVRRPRLPSAPRGCPCAASLALAASCTLARV